MSKLIGTNPNQVPSNADLGSAAFMDKKEFLLSKGSDISAIDAVIPKTAVDVFIYDTSKDSDGGAWRKRTQHTSWYNERLNTTTRGSRKEFPAVAVIVAELRQLTIYDGDDPDLPMWMVFNLIDNESHFNGFDNNRFIGSVAALNGLICTGITHVNGYFNEISFIEDTGYSRTPGYYQRLNASISQRSETGITKTQINSTDGVVHRYVNDVAMTVLPNAPIDAATGLPVPTIAVATNGGVSVIKDDGAVVDITESSSSTNITANVEFLDNGQLVFRADGNTDFKWIGRINLPMNDINYSYLDESKMPYVMYSGGAGTARLMLTPPYAADASTATTAFTSYKDNVIAGTIKGFGQGTTDPTVDNSYNGNIVNYTSSSYNTGWMHGEIKLATLSDTDAGQLDNTMTVEDRSVDGNDLQVFGTVTKTAVATGADLVGYSGFSTTGPKVNYLRTSSFQIDLDNGFCFMGWIKIDGAVGTQDQHFFDMINDPTGPAPLTRINLFYQHSTTNFVFVPGPYASTVNSAAVSLGKWHHVVALSTYSGTTDLYINGELSGTGGGGFSHTGFYPIVTLGTRYEEYSGSAYGLNGSMALIRVSKSNYLTEPIPSPAQIKKIYNDEKFLFQENAKATLYGSSDAVTALAYDDSTELLHVGTSSGRSVFQGLRRIDNTTDAVGAAISASNGMVAED